jgi:protein O-mannosyl-transferase
MVAAAYLPALRCGFIWDDDAYVTENLLLVAPNGLNDIWLSAHSQSQYFPLVFTTFRYERLLWGLNPFGFHLVNVVFHGCNAVLVWIVLRRLQVPGAWLAAAIFALHPVHVETVAWVTELKNLESLFFYLLSLLAWLRFVDPPDPPRWRYYALALTACLLALFAKTTACTLAAAMVLVLWMRRQKITWLRTVQILPFLVAGLGFGLLTLWWEKHLGNYDQQFGLSLTFLQRVLLAARALWFYAGKLAWPVNLTFSYPRWELNPTQPLQYVPLIACLAAAALLWKWRDKIGRGALAGIVFFVAALSPLLGFIPEYTFFYSYVADHYQYAASIGLLALFASLVSRLFARTGFLPLVQATLLLLLGCLTWHQCGAYRNRETLWRDTLAKNPGSWMAHHNLGIELFAQGQLDEALEQYRAAVDLYPQGGHEQSDLGTALMEKGLYSEAIEHLETALAINPKLFQAQNNLALAYSRTGHDDQAVAHFRQALQLKPDALGVRLNLGKILQRQGKLDAAIENYREASKRFPTEVEPLRRLAGVLTEKEQFPQAAEACRQALQLAPNSPDLTQQLRLLEAHKTN